jgi:hypothetical protein
MLLPPAATALLLPPLLDRLQDRFASFLFLLRNDTTGVEERFRFVPILLLCWLLANLLGAPLTHLVARFFGSSAELRKSTGNAFAIAAIQCGFFGLTWLVIAWGRRSIDWAVFAASCVATSLVAKWGHELPLGKSFLLVIIQTGVGLLVTFLIAFTAAELGWTSF